jgi:hypothetical protein
MKQATCMHCTYTTSMGDVAGMYFHLKEKHPFEFAMLILSKFVVTETMTENKKKTQQEIELEQQEAEYHMMQEAEKRQAEAEAEEEQRT